MQAVSVTTASFASPTHPRYVYSQTPQPMGSLLPPFISKRAANPDPPPSPLLSFPLPPAALDIKPSSSSSFPLSPSLSPLYHNSLSLCYQLGLSRPMASRPGPSLMPPCERREKMGEKKENYTPGQTALSRGWKRCSDLWCGLLSPPLSASAGRACYSSFGSRGFATFRTSTRWSALCESAVVGES